MKRTGKYHGYVGLLVLAVSWVLMLQGVRPFSTSFYNLAWWPYIFIVDHLVYALTGDSLWVNRRGEFWRLIPLSVLFWMIFEGVNIYLKNWHYINIPTDLSLGGDLTVAGGWWKWPGFFVSYGTVLPLLYETYDLLEALGLYRGRRVRAIPVTTAWHLPFALIGLFFLFAPMFWPRYTFPLIWGAFSFLLEPVIRTRGGRSIMGEWENGSLRTFFLMLSAGFICGGLWEFWNYWAVTKWVYTVPYVGGWKIFEMPVLGFAGFPPFAVECLVMTNFISLFRGGRGWMREDAGRPARTHPAWVAVYVVVWFFVFFAVGRSIETYTFQSYL